MIKSFKHAFNGIQLLFTRERNARLHLIAAIIIILAGLYVKLNSSQWVDIFLCFGIVMAAEAVNTALEKLCNKVEPTVNPEIKKIKDLAAAAVLICATVSAIVGFIIFLPNLKLIYGQ